MINEIESHGSSRQTNHVTCRANIDEEGNEKVSQSDQGANEIDSVDVQVITTDQSFHPQTVQNRQHYESMRSNHGPSMRLGGRALAGRTQYHPNAISSSF